MTAQNLKKHTYQVTLPNGEKVTRRTTRSYACAIASESIINPGTWIVWQWAGTETLAQRYVKPGDRHSKIIPVDNPRESVVPDTEE